MEEVQEITCYSLNKQFIDGIGTSFRNYSYGKRTNYDGVGYLDDRPECRFGDSRSPVGLAGSPALPGLYFIQQDS